MREVFKIGEKVRLLHAKGEGIVQRIISPTKLEVLIDDFIEMEVGIGEIVKINVAEAILRRPEPEADEEANPSGKRKATNSYVPPKPDLPPSFVLYKNDDMDYEFWLVNQGRNELLFAVYLRVGNKFSAFNSGVLAPGDNYFLGKQTPKDFHMVRSIYLQVIEFARIEHPKPIPSFALEINCKTDIFTSRSRNIPELNVEGWEFLLVEKASAFSTIESSNSDLRITDSRPAKPPKIVDLHMDKIVDNPLGISSSAMLNLQMEAFEKAITDAQAHKIDSMVFIHGIGTGALKKAIHNRLMDFEFVRNFELADPIEYGNGATIVYF